LRAAQQSLRSPWREMAGAECGKLAPRCATIPL